MKIKRLEHVAITVKDMDKARDTWVNVLGIGCASRWRTSTAP